MTGKDIYLRAIISLGFEDDQTFKNKAVVVINQVYEDLLSSFPDIERKPINNLNEAINLPETVCMTAMVYGVAERLAVGTGDGELQQYFSAQYHRSRARISRTDRVYDVMPR